MPSHDVFDSYAKIMEESGAMDKPLEKMAEEKPLRHDSLDISDFEMLYGVKPNGKDEKGMIEQGHPDSVFIAPAYDRMNGLVENQTERQAIMMDIALKPNDGKLIQERYIKANAELVNELTRVAFLCDKTGDVELMKIADECTEALLCKRAFPFLIVGVVAAVIGAWKMFGRDSSFSEGVSQDAEKFLVEIQDVVNTESEKHPELTQDLAPLVSEVSYIKEFADKAARIQMVSAQMSDDKDKAVEVTHGVLNSDSREKIVNFFNRYKLAAAKLAEDIPSYLSMLRGKEQEYKDRHWDITEMALKTWRFFVPSDTEDATQALEALKVSLSKIPGDVDSKLAVMDKLAEHKDNINQIKDLLDNENMTVDQLEQMAKDQGGKETPATKSAPSSAVPELPMI
jgi:hypothetical protein